MLKYTIRDGESPAIEWKRSYIFQIMREVNWKQDTIWSSARKSSPGVRNVVTKNNWNQISGFPFITKNFFQDGRPSRPSWIRPRPKSIGFFLFRWHMCDPNFKSIWRKNIFFKMAAPVGHLGSSQALKKPCFRAISDIFAFTSPFCEMQRFANLKLKYSLFQ